MRKKNQEITDKSVIDDILKSSEICRIGMVDNGLPYVLPFNYGYQDGCIYIHCAHKGHKMDVLSHNPKVCFEIEKEAKIIQNDKACKWSTAYRSVIGYGIVDVVTDYSLKEKALGIIMAHNGEPDLIDFDPKSVNGVSVLKLKINSITGKQSGNWDKVHQADSLNLATERLKLEEITMDDLVQIHLLESIPAVDEFNTLGIPDSIENTKKNVEPAIRARFEKPRPSYTWKIVLKQDNRFIGLAGLFLSNDKFKLGEIYYKIDPEYWGHGYATETAKCMIKACFEEMDLHKVEAGVATENIRSIRVLEKVGMVREGLRRKILPIRGEWKDNYHYAIVADDPRDY